MSATRQWYEGLDAEVILLVDRLVGADAPTDDQIAESVDLMASYSVDALGLKPDERERLEAAVGDLEEAMRAADPRHKFLRMYDGLELDARLVRFYSSGDWANFQHRVLTRTAYAPAPMHVDFQAIYWLENPDFTGEMIGDHYVEFANLITDLAGDPQGTECYAHLAIDPKTTTVYLMEPSGNPERIADDLDAFLGRLEIPVAGEEA